MRGDGVELVHIRPRHLEPGREQPDLVPRYDHTLLMLPTGQVLATGGRDFLTSKHCPQIWTPGQGWTEPSALACDDVKREYHSSALLLPDGRILTGGGGDNVFEFPDSRKLRLYCPPYLFNTQGGLAARPVIGEWPRNVAWGDTFTICTANPTAITKVCLMRPGAVTHSFDQNGRYVPLEILDRRSSPAQLVVRAPASPDSAPPGDYMMFILGSADGPDVPSLAQWVNVGCASCDATAPAANTDLFIEIVTESSVYPLWVAKGDDGTVGSATRYDFRRSTQPITAGNFASATRVGMPPPLCPGWPEFQEVGGLAQCTQYYFALKTGDGGPNWSVMSNVEQATTIGTGVCGGGGGGFAARRVEGEEGAGAGSRLSAPSVVGPDAASAGFGLSGTEQGPTVASAHGLTSAPLVVETRREGEGTWRVTIRFGTEADGLDLSASSVLVDQAGSGSGRDVLGRIEPGASEVLLGLCSLRERGRIAIRGAVALEQIAPRIRHRGQDYTLADARHSRMGALGAGFLADGGSPELVAGDVLDLTYAATGDARLSAPTWYLVVRREGTGIPGAFSRRPDVDRPLPSRFVLHTGEPNPAASGVIIRFDLPQESTVRLDVFDLLGRRVATVAEGSYPAGNNAAGWDLRDTRGAPVRPGVYVCRLSSGNIVARSKLTVIP